MSLARAALFKPRATVVSAAVSRRLASSAAHDDHHHHPEDNTVYPQETFANKTWRNWALAGLAAILFYKFAPAPGDETYLTRWIKMYQTEKSVWTELNNKHLALSAVGQIENLVVADARRPPVHRLRYPQSFEQHSTHAVPVGTSVDLSDLLVKGDKS
ncbi:hypothetical protein BDW22DRAFT_1395900 [Trametopsis cervina]|nr:hypothetical protein BDW22DRAFT_1395900 [Trametopsis cervina]